jgi:hypothetical protein
MRDEEPISKEEVERAHRWIRTTRPIKYLLLASIKLFKHMVLWILGLGIGVSGLIDLWNRLIGGGPPR